MGHYLHMFVTLDLSQILVSSIGFTDRAEGRRRKWKTKQPEHNSYDGLLNIAMKTDEYFL